MKFMQRVAAAVVTVGVSAQVFAAPPSFDWNKFEASSPDHWGQLTQLIEKTWRAGSQTESPSNVGDDEIRTPIRVFNVLTPLMRRQFPRPLLRGCLPDFSDIRQDFFEGLGFSFETSEHPDSDMPHVQRSGQGDFMDIV